MLLDVRKRLDLHHKLQLKIILYILRVKLDLFIFCRYELRQKHIRYYDICFIEGLHIFTIDTNYDMTFYNLVL